ncbi:MAG: hypothetical protein JNM22_03600 [Saprospiraceae bacterium]|nr:hypothetical protein [Saprospiraceae bacterium]
MDNFIPELLSYATFTAVFGFLGKSLYDLLIDRRKANLAYINSQIEKLYGPLFILDNAGTTAYQTFLKKIGREGDPSLDQPLSEEEIKEWALWVEDIFMPINLEMENIIKQNSHLLNEKDTPKPILDFICHVTVYKTVLKKWKSNQFNEIFSLIDFPEDFTTYIQKSYTELKQKQYEYLKKLKI